MTYKTIKTATGKKFRVPMSEEEIEERQLYWLIVTLLPFISTVLLFTIWLKVGG